VSSALVSKPGKPPGLCSAGLLDVCSEEVEEVPFDSNLKLASLCITNVPKKTTTNYT
jgi:hypothetical protein